MSNGTFSPAISCCLVSSVTGQVFTTHRTLTGLRDEFALGAALVITAARARDAHDELG